MLYSDLPLTAQTSYAQLLDAALASEHFRSVADLTGSFASKTVKGHRYWYYQFTEPSGKLRQLFVGPDTDAVRGLVERSRQPAAGEPLVPLTRAAIALGCAAFLPRHFRVIRRLAEYGFFRAGGVLVGTHAFLALGNMLGVRWDEAARTQDIDLAHAGKNLALALPADIEVRTHNAIESLNMGFLPVSGLASKAGATYLNPKEPEFRLDFLTTMHRGGEAPYEHPQLHITLQPLKFMEFSLTQVQQAVVFCQEGAVMVNVPHPARFALHKLLVAGEREGSFAAKTAKDIQQAAALLLFLQGNRPWEVDETRADMLGRGKGWRDRLQRGVTLLNKSYPDVRWLEA